MNLRMTAAAAAIAVGLAALVSGCGGNNPVAPAHPIALATFSIDFGGGQGTKPAMPIVAHFTFGVQSNPSTGKTPSPLILGGTAVTKAGQTIGVNLSRADAVIAQRLSDGVNEATYRATDVPNVGSTSTTEMEASALHDDVPVSGPDLSGYTPTSLVVVVDQFSLEQHSDGLWWVIIKATGTIYGHRS